MWYIESEGSEEKMTRRQALLDAAVAHVAAHGVGDLSLRGLATALGTSHRMLVYHFGSKERLLVEVVRAVEAHQRAALAALGEDPDLSPQEQGWRLWCRLADPSMWPHERLFFELYGQALQGRAHTRELLDGVVDAWLGPVTELNVALGMSPEDARAGARLGVAVTRGLLLDLLATGDRAGCDAAMRLFLTRYVP
jgi:AcrR family transcriptional regulator